MPEDSLLRPTVPTFRRRPPATIGAFEVRAPSNELAGPDGVLRLRPRLMDVLLRLAEAPGEVVPRQVLLDDVWPRRLVADEVLSRTIADLRTALGDDAREARYIETLPKVGYRLIAPVVTAGDAGRARDDAIEAAPFVPVPEPGPAFAASPVAAAPPIRSARRALGSVLAVAAVVVAALLVLQRGTTPATIDLERQLAGAGQFSSDLEMETSPRFSADGTRVAFALGNDERSRIVVQDVATRTRTEFGVPGALLAGPTFFPDGERLAYFRRVGKACDIVERNLATGAERSLLGCDDRPGARFDIAPDGGRLVYASPRAGDAGLRVLELATGTIARITTPASAAGLDVFPRYSPDGKRIAFMRGTAGGREVWLVSAATPGDARMIGAARGLAYGLAWMGPDGPLLVAADFLGFRALNRLDVASGTATLAGARGAQFPDVSRNGDIVYEAASYQADLRLIDVAHPAKPPQKLWPSARYTNYPQFSPDGRRVVFLSNRDNTSSLFVGELGGAARRLPLPAEFVFARAHWSHDGQALYAVRGGVTAGDGPQHGVRIDVATGRVDVLAGLGERVSDVRDAADGRTLYFATLDGPLMQVWQAPADAPDRHTRLPLPLVEDYDIRGGLLAYAEPHQSDLVVCTLPALRCAPAGLPPQDGRTGWALADDALWIGIYGDPGELQRFDLATRVVTTRLPHGPYAIGPNLAIAPDQQLAIVARQEPPAIDLMLARRPR
jgi:DNA-binding winged helix-turn-helix (wHTH) protein